MSNTVEARLPGSQSITAKFLTILCCLALFVLPLLLGGNIPVVQAIVQTVVLFVAVCLAFSSLCLGQRPAALTSRTSTDWIYALVTSVLLFVVLSLIPLPLSFLEFISPLAAAGYKAVGSQWGYISVSPYLTYQQFLWIVSVCLIVVWVRRQPIENSRVGLGGTFSSAFSLTIQASGFLSAVIAIVNWVLGNEFYLGLVDPQRGDLHSSRAHWPFVNPNHLAAYLELALILAVGKIARSAGSWKRHPYERWGESMLRLMTQPRVLFSLLTNSIGIVCMLIALFLSASKAGIILSLFGVGLLSIYSVTHVAKPDRVINAGQKRKSVKHLLLVISCALIAIFAMTSDLGQNLVVERFEQGLVTRLDDARTHLYRSTMQISLDYPFTGVGLGNWHLIAPQYVPAALAGFSLDYAHNEYLQVLTELGYFCAVALFIAALLLILRTARTFVAADEIDRFNIFASSLVLVLPLLHAVVDFPLHIPAISFALAVQLGLHLQLLDRCSGQGREALSLS